MVQYIKLTNNASVARVSPTGDTINLSLSGNYFNESFGTSENTITCKYRYCISDGTFGDYETVTATKSGNSYSYSAILSGFDYRNSYIIEVVVSDALMTVSKSITLLKGIPVFDWGENDFNFHVPVKIGDTQITEDQLQQLITSITYGDYIVERGVADSWKYQKYASGDVVMEYGGEITFPGEDSTFDSGITGLYMVYTDIALPVSLVDANCSVTASINWTYSEWVQAGKLDVNNVRIRKFANINGIRDTTNYVSIIVHGKWK